SPRASSLWGQLGKNVGRGAADLSCAIPAADKSVDKNRAEVRGETAASGWPEDDRNTHPSEYRQSAARAVAMSPAPDRRVDGCRWQYQYGGGDEYRLQQPVAIRRLADP